MRDLIQPLRIFSGSLITPRADEKLTNQYLRRFWRQCDRERLVVTGGIAVLFAVSNLSFLYIATV